MRLKTFFGVIIIITFLPITVFATVASSSNIYKGIDVSNWQGYIDYNSVKNDGIEIVYIKSSQGSNIVDSYFRINYNNAKANGLKVGFYHFLTARSEEEAKKEADFFCSVISNTSPDCKLAMDFEVFGDLSIEEINNISIAFLERVKEVSKKEVIIYSDSSNAKNIFNIDLAKAYPLWIAEYGVEVPQATNWENWEGFQYTSQGKISGIKGYVDKDNFTENIYLNETTKIEETGESQNFNQDTTYIVKSGNTLSMIASLYNTTVNELVLLNNIQNPNLIFPNEKIIVPIKSKEDNKSYSSGHVIYTVQKGDTLSELALRFKTTVTEIAKLNDIENINLIYIGEKLRIKNEL